MVLMSVSSSVSPMRVRISNLSLLEKCKPHLGPSTSQYQILVLAGLAFFRRIRKIRTCIAYVADVCFHLFSNSQTKILFVTCCYYINTYAKLCMMIRWHYMVIRTQ